jgi:hypothetical protein
MALVIAFHNDVIKRIIENSVRPARAQSLVGLKVPNAAGNGKR